MNAAPILQTVDLKKHYQQGEHITKALDGVNPLRQRGGVRGYCRHIRLRQVYPAAHDGRS